MRRTLVAPILPDPSRRISPSPANRVSSRPNGIEPKRYPIANAAAKYGAASDQFINSGIRELPRTTLSAAIIHNLPGRQGQADAALEARFVEGRVLRARAQIALVEHVGLVRVEQRRDRPARPAASRPAGSRRISAGRADSAPHEPRKRKAAVMHEAQRRRQQGLEADRPIGGLRRRAGASSRRPADCGRRRSRR